MVLGETVCNIVNSDGIRVILTETSTARSALLGLIFPLSRFQVQNMPLCVHQFSWSCLPYAIPITEPMGFHDMLSAEYWGHLLIKTNSVSIEGDRY